MSNEQKKETKTETKSVSPEEMKELRAKKKAERLKAMRDRDQLGLPASLVEKLKKEGKRPRLANRENVEFWKSRGYDILQVSSESSDEVYSGKSASGGVEVTVSKHDPNGKAIWMVTDEENAQILDEIRDEAADRMKGQISRPKDPNDTLPGTLKRV